MARGLGLLTLGATSYDIELSIQARAQARAFLSFLFLYSTTISKDPSTFLFGQVFTNHYVCAVKKGMFVNSKMFCRASQIIF